jgi:hypothetical protein
MFGRRANEFGDFSTSKSDPLSASELERRHTYLESLVYPTIYDKARAKRDKEGAAYNSSRMLITDKFPPGAIVFAKGCQRSAPLRGSIYCHPP